jgi:hypothetical protein
MFPLIRILILAAAGALTAASVHAEDHYPIPAAAAQANLSPAPVDDCHLLRRAISRHTCHVRLWRENIETAENR